MQAAGERRGTGILDVDGTRIIVPSLAYPQTSAADMGEVQGVLDTTEITP